MRLSRLRFLALLLFCTAIIPTGHAQRYARDSSFADAGLLMPTGNLDAWWTSVYTRSVLVQPDGKILLCGTLGAPNGSFAASGFSLMRFKANGTPDSTFGTNGYYRNTANSNTYAIYVSNSVLTASGQILTLVQEYSATDGHARLYRTTAAGTPDYSFGTNGSIMLSPYTYTSLTNIVVQPDGKILLGGSYIAYPQTSAFLMMRLNANGSIDNSFGQSGHAASPYASLQNGSGNASAMFVQPDGRIVFTSYFFPSGGSPGGSTLVVCRYKANGTPDSSFAQNGLKTDLWDSTNVYPSYLNVSANGDIYVGGFTEPTNSQLHPSLSIKPFLAAFDTYGTALSTFGSGGRVTVGTPSLTLFQPYDFLNGNGGGNSYPPVILRQADGKFIITGMADTSDTRHPKLCRYTASGAPDLTFCDSNILHLPRGHRDLALCGALQPDGKVLIAGAGYLFAKAHQTYGDTLLPLCYRLRPETNGGNSNPQGIAATGGQSGATIEVYPNPAPGGALHIAYSGVPLHSALQLSVTDGTGRRVHDQQFVTAASSAGELSCILPAALPAGLYFLHFSAADGTRMVRQVLLMR